MIWFLFKASPIENGTLASSGPRTCLAQLCAKNCLEEVVLHVDLDGAVALGVGDAGEDVTVSHLVLVEEGLLGLVDLALDDLAGAGGARAGAARVGEVEAGLLGGVDDEDVVGALDGLVDVVLLGDELDGVAEAGGGA